MKYIIQIFTFALFFTALSTTQAQEFKFAQEQIVANKGTHEAVVVTLAPKTKEVRDAWEDFLKDRYDVKMKGNGLFSNKDILVAEDVNIPTISSKNMNLYTRIVAQGLNTEMAVYASLGYDIDLNPQDNRTEFGELERMVQTFLDDYLLTYYREKIETTREEIEDFTKDRNKLQEDIADNKKKIQELTTENQEMDTELTQKITRLDELTTESKTRNDELQSITRKLSYIK